jgi:SNF2 family DNA or RNA helicase
MTDYRRELRDFIAASLDNQCTETSPQAEQPNWITTALRPHQLTLLAGAKNLEYSADLHPISSEPQLLTKYGIIADRVGAGKSLVALSLVKEHPPESARMIMRNGNGHLDALSISVKRMPPTFEFRESWRDLSSELLTALPAVEGKIYTKVALFIIPHNVCPQWESYIRDHTTLNVCSIKRVKDYEKSLASMFSSDLILVSSTMLKKFMGLFADFSSIIWSRLFVDEADSILCTVRHGEISARFTWFITASWVNMLFPSGIHSYSLNNLPDDIRAVLGSGQVPGISSHYGFIYNTLSDTRYTLFTKLMLKNSDAWVDASLLQPVITHETLMCKAPANLSILKGFISAAAMEALHAGDTAGAMDVLGLKTTTKETLVDRVTMSLRGDLAQAERLLDFKRTMDYSTPQVKAQALEKAEQKVQRLREQLEALEQRIKSAAVETCPICMDTPQTPTLTPCCRHSFCLSCLCECMTSRPACPLCRTPIGSVSELLVVGETDTTTVETNPLPTKGAALLDLLQSSNENQRFLVFSAHEASFKGLRELLSARGIRCELLSGSGARVERLRNQFKDGTIRVLCMNARHVGAGINLEAATHVVLYHRMNTELEKQVIGRAVRFERSSELKIIHLAHDGETATNGAHGSEVIMHSF